ncbi:MAG: Glu-tRNA(Gln) amidotransferase subunit GatE [Candidatus Woesearchaeota archaeon]
MIINYEKFGLKCGLEIHQQLETKKLFCNCDSVLKNEEPHFVVSRTLRAVEGEMGDIDVAAAYEMLKGRRFIYEGYYDTTCLVEFDEAPPNPMNKEALETALQVSLLLNAKPVDEINIMRKTVIDGSNTTGFQRTALIATKGYIETSQGRVTIPTICIEEESARQIAKEDGTVIYRLDRLGIPLIEVATGPEIKSPDQCKEVAEKIGMVIRSTGKSKRGLGTVRQDINVSIAEGNRVEIKGAQDLNLIPKIVELEIIRQLNLIEIKKELYRRFAKKTKIEVKDATRIFRNTNSEIIKKALSEGGVVLAIAVPFFSKLLGKELQRGRRLGTEISDRAKIIGGVGGIIHSDENLERYNISRVEIEELSKFLGIGMQDAFIIIADKKEKSEKAMKAAVERIYECFEGVPKEVRNANPEGTTTFLRPMPGSSRMYPETDIPPIVPDISDISLPELITDKIQRYRKDYNLGFDLAEFAAYSQNSENFEKLVNKFQNIKPAFIAETYFGVEKSLSRKYEKEIRVPFEIFEKIFEALNNNEISKEIIPEIIFDYYTTKNLNINKFKILKDKELEAEVKRIVKENQGLEFNKMVAAVMSVLRGKGDSFKIIELIKKYQKL